MDLIPVESKGLKNVLGCWFLNWNVHPVTWKPTWLGSTQSFNSVGLDGGWECAFLAQLLGDAGGTALAEPLLWSLYSFQ